MSMLRNPDKVLITIWRIPSLVPLVLLVLQDDWVAYHLVALDVDRDGPSHQLGLGNDEYADVIKHVLGDDLVIPWRLASNPRSLDGVEFGKKYRP